MGYDLHIQRPGGLAIGRDEWLAFVAADGSFHVAGEIFLPDHRPIHALNDAEQKAPFYWYQGEVLVTAPDDPTILAMVEIAKKLGAVVIGDDGEAYGS